MTEKPPQDPAAMQTWLHEALSIDQAAAFLGVDPKWMDRARMSGVGPIFRRLTSRTIVYTREDLLAFMEAKKHQSTAEYAQAADQPDSAALPPGGEASS